MPQLCELPTELAQALAAKGPAIRRSLLRWPAPPGRNDLPWRRPGRSPYEILIAEALLKRTTATAAHRVYEDFIHAYPTPQTLAESEEDDVVSLLTRVGLQQQRARGLRSMASALATLGELPREKEALLQIPHVGAYAAAAVLSLGFGIPAAMVDSNVERVLSRLFAGAMVGQTRHTKQIPALADALLPRARHRDFNLKLVDLGAFICRYVHPRCAVCPIAGVCDSPRA